MVATRFVKPKGTAQPRLVQGELLDRYLITNEHVVKDAAQVRLVTSAGLIFARVVKVDAANDLALLKAEGRFAPLPISPSRGIHLGAT